MTVTIGGSTYEDLLFAVNGTDYRVSHAPTVSEPYFELFIEDFQPLLDWLARN